MSWQIVTIILVLLGLAIFSPAVQQILVNLLGTLLLAVIWILQRLGIAPSPNGLLQRLYRWTMRWGHRVVRTFTIILIAGILLLWTAYWWNIPGLAAAVLAAFAILAIALSLAARALRRIGQAVDASWIGQQIKRFWNYDMQPGDVSIADALHSWSYTMAFAAFAVYVLAGIPAMRLSPRLFFIILLFGLFMGLAGAGLSRRSNFGRNAMIATAVILLAVSAIPEMFSGKSSYVADRLREAISDRTGTEGMHLADLITPDEPPRLKKLEHITYRQLVADELGRYEFRASQLLAKSQTQSLAPAELTELRVARGKVVELQKEYKSLSQDTDKPPMRILNLGAGQWMLFFFCLAALIALLKFGPGYVKSFEVRSTVDGQERISRKGTHIAGIIALLAGAILLVIVLYMAFLILTNLGSFAGGASIPTPLAGLPITFWILAIPLILLAAGFLWKLMAGTVGGGGSVLGPLLGLGLTTSLVLFIFYVATNSQASALGLSIPYTATYGSFPRGARLRFPTTPPPASLSAKAEFYANKYGVDPALVKGVIQQESNWNPCPRTSSAGAQGIMQLMPDTQKRYGVTNPCDPDQCMDAGVKYLRFLIDRYPGNLPLAIAAYNMGEGDKQGRGADKFKGMTWEQIAADPRLPAETRNYVPGVMAYAAQYSQGGIPSAVPAAPAPVVAANGTVRFSTPANQKTDVGITLAPGTYRMRIEGCPIIDPTIPCIKADNSGWPVASLPQLIDFYNPRGKFGKPQLYLSAPLGSPTGEGPLEANDGMTLTVGHPLTIVSVAPNDRKNYLADNTGGWDFTIEKIS